MARNGSPADLASGSRARDEERHHPRRRPRGGRLGGDRFARHSTASRRVAAQTRDRVLAAAGELDYVPHSGARALSTRRTDTIGVMLPDLHGEFFSELIRGIDLAARARGPASAAVPLARRPRRGGGGAARDAQPRRCDDRDVALCRTTMRARATPGRPMPLVLLGSGGHVGEHPRFVDRQLCRRVRDDRASGRRAATGASPSSPGPPTISRRRERLRGYRAALARIGGGVAGTGRAGRLLRAIGPRRRAACSLAGPGPTRSSAPTT